MLSLETPASAAQLLKKVFLTYGFVLKNTFLGIAVLIFLKVLFWLLLYYHQSLWQYWLGFIFLEGLSALVAFWVIQQIGSGIFSIRPYFQALMAVLIQIIFCVLLYTFSTQLSRGLYHWLGINHSRILIAFLLWIIGLLFAATLVAFLYVVPAIIIDKKPLIKAFFYSFYLMAYNLFKTIFGLAILLIIALTLQPLFYLQQFHFSFGLSLTVDAVVSLLVYPGLLSYYLLLYRDSQLRYQLQFED